VDMEGADGYCDLRAAEAREEWDRFEAQVVRLFEQYDAEHGTDFAGTMHASDAHLACDGSGAGELYETYKRGPEHEAHCAAVRELCRVELSDYVDDTGSGSLVGLMMDSVTYEWGYDYGDDSEEFVEGPVQPGTIWRYCRDGDVAERLVSEIQSLNGSMLERDGDFVYGKFSDVDAAVKELTEDGGHTAEER